MNVDERKTERVLKLLLETFPELPRSEADARVVQPERSELPILISVASTPASHGIWELNSALSE